jgi:hypothetical protein
MVDFKLTDDGDLELQAFGERSQEDIWGRAYPVICQTMLNTPRDSEGELIESGKEMIRKAVQAEKERLTGKKKRKLADTELGRSVQSQMDAPAALVNRYVKQIAAEVLKKSPTSGRKQ